MVEVSVEVSGEVDAPLVSGLLMLLRLTAPSEPRLSSVV